MNYPRHITLVEVGPRDGLQNEPQFLATEKKIELINQLSDTGLTRIEVSSFVSPKMVPQLSDHKQVFKSIHRNPRIRYSALVPNIQGLNAALDANISEIAVFTAASETFNQRNIHCSIQESLARFEPVIQTAKAHQISIRGYISCVLGCPYEGHIDFEKTARLAKTLIELGCDEISLGDTIGVGTPKQTQTLIETALMNIPAEKIAMHFHDTYGQAIANIFASLQCGIHIFDTSIAGLGGCPYAQGATGNVATEDVLYLMHGLGIDTGVDIFKIVQIGHDICRTLNRTNQSKVGRALLPL